VKLGSLFPVLNVLFHICVVQQIQPKFCLNFIALIVHSACHDILKNLTFWHAAHVNICHHVSVFLFGKCLHILAYGLRIYSVDFFVFREPLYFCHFILIFLCTRHILCRYDTISISDCSSLFSSHSSVSELQMAPVVQKVMHADGTQLKDIVWGGGGGGGIGAGWGLGDEEEERMFLFVCLSVSPHAYVFSLLVNCQWTGIKILFFYLHLFSISVRGQIYSRIMGNEIPDSGSISGMHFVFFSLHQDSFNFKEII
ncbi:hypothetical protein ACJX0J_024591, partial [Zea mays]